MKRGRGSGKEVRRGKMENAECIECNVKRATDTAKKCKQDFPWWLFLFGKGWGRREGTLAKKRFRLSSSRHLFVSGVF